MDVIKPISEKSLAVCTYITEGISVNKACNLLDFNPNSFFYEMSRNEELLKHYMRARESRADARFENLQTLLDECKSGLVDAQTARVLIDAIKWQMGKEKPKVYGDSTIIRGDKDNPIELGLSTLLDAATAKHKALSAPDVIDGEFVNVTIKRPADLI